MYVYKRVNIHICIHIYVYIYLCLYMCIYQCYICVQAHIYIYTLAVLKDSIVLQGTKTGSVAEKPPCIDAAQILFWRAPWENTRATSLLSGFCHGFLRANVNIM